MNEALNYAVCVLSFSTCGVWCELVEIQTNCEKNMFRDVPKHIVQKCQNMVLGPAKTGGQIKTKISTNSIKMVAGNLLGPFKYNVNDI